MDILMSPCWEESNKQVNILRPRQNGHRFADDIFKRIFLNKNVRISIKISLKCVPKGPINNNPTSVQIMAWRRSRAKPLSEPMMVSLMTHICVTRPQWLKSLYTYCRWHHLCCVILVVRWLKDVVSIQIETSCLPLVRPGFKPRHLRNPPL